MPHISEDEALQPTPEVEADPSPAEEVPAEEPEIAEDGAQSEESLEEEVEEAEEIDWSNLPPINKHPRVREILEQNRTLKSRTEAFETLAGNPIVAKALQEAISGKGETKEEAPAEEQYVPLTPPEAFAGNEGALFEIAEQLNRTLFETRKQLTQVQTATSTTAQTFEQQQLVARKEQGRKELEEAVKPLAEKAGIRLSEEQFGELAVRVYHLGSAEQSLGREWTLPGLVAKAFPDVAAPQLKRAAETQKRKADTSAGRPNAAGGGRAAKKDYVDPKDAMEDAFRTAFPNGLPRE